MMSGLWEGYRQALRQEMEACFPPFAVFRMARYHLGWEDGGQGEGKMLRPLLCLAACRAVGEEVEKALPTAAAVELVHNFSLIHDDIQDASPYRRGRPTVWKVWGEAQAITAGDALFAAARLCLLRLRGLPPSRVMAACRLLDEACLRLCHGQFLDLEYESRPAISLQDYTRMARNKTSALMEASLSLGGLVGGARRPALRALERCGSSLGLAFQVQDDVLGLWGDPRVTGKQAEDIFRKKKTFPLVYALERGKPPLRQPLLRLLEKPALALSDVAALREALEGAGIRAASLQAAQGFYSRALHALEPLGEGAVELKEIIASLGERDR